MNKAIKLVMTGLLVSVNMLAQETDSIQQYGTEVFRLTGKNLLLREEW